LKKIWELRPFIEVCDKAGDIEDLRLNESEATMNLIRYRINNGIRRGFGREMILPY